jgi:hypothetical protein
MTISLRQQSVIVLVIGWTALSMAPGGSAFAQFKPSVDLAKIKPLDDPAKEAYRKEVDKEYQSKLKAIPDQPQKKVDPWGNVRSSTPAPK